MKVLLLPGSFILKHSAPNQIAVQNIMLFGLLLSVVLISCFGIGGFSTLEFQLLGEVPLAIVFQSLQSVSATVRFLFPLFLQC